LNTISSNKHEIRILNEKISTKGNLQWTKESLSRNASPAHGIWNLNTKIYVTGLNSEIKNKKTKNLKEALIHITQKIELIETYLSTHRQINEEKLKKYKAAMGESMIPLLDEVIGLVDTTKKHLEKEFGIKKV